MQTSYTLTILSYVCSCIILYLSCNIPWVEIKLVYYFYSSYEHFYILTFITIKDLDACSFGFLFITAK